jgi:hypothetical protein
MSVKMEQKGRLCAPAILPCVVNLLETLEMGLPEVNVHDGNNCETPFWDASFLERSGWPTMLKDLGGWYSKSLRNYDLVILTNMPSTSHPDIFHDSVGWAEAMQIVAQMGYAVDAVGLGAPAPSHAAACLAFGRAQVEGHMP